MRRVHFRTRQRRLTGRRLDLHTSNPGNSPEMHQHDSPYPMRLTSPYADTRRSVERGGHVRQRVRNAHSGSGGHAADRVRQVAQPATAVSRCWECATPTTKAPDRISAGQGPETGHRRLVGDRGFEPLTSSVSSSPLSVQAVLAGALHDHLVRVYPRDLCRPKADRKRFVVHLVLGDGWRVLRRAVAS
jgi:hypothetical protein